MIKRLWTKRGQASESSSGTQAPDKVPRHVAIIMDGNGRWAKRRGLPRQAGHHFGMKNVKRITEEADRLGIEYLTLYAFSTENWKRPKEEVDFLMKLPQQFLEIELHNLMANNVKVLMMGSRDGVPPFTLEAIDEAMEKTADNTGLVLNFALNYGGRMEMLDAFRSIAADAREGRIDPEQIDEALVGSRLFSASLPDPDLLIRTSGELRLSNFMLWQLAYSELWFTDVYWPGFTEKHLLEAVREYGRRARRYGGI